MKRKRNFTIIEVLTIVAAVAILVGILYPVFAKAKDKAQRLTLVAPPERKTIVVNNIVEDYVNGDGPQVYSNRNGIQADVGERYALVNTSDGMMKIYNRVQFQSPDGKTMTCLRTEVQAHLTAQEQSIVLVGHNKKGETLIVAFVEAVNPIAEDDIGLSDSGKWERPLP